jgi:hypothetical protein
MRLGRVFKLKDKNYLINHFILSGINLLKNGYFFCKNKLLIRLTRGTVLIKFNYSDFIICRIHST